MMEGINSHNIIHNVLALALQGKLITVQFQLALTRPWKSGSNYNCFLTLAHRDIIADISILLGSHLSDCEIRTSPTKTILRSTYSPYFVEVIFIQSIFL